MERFITTHIFISITTPKGFFFLKTDGKVHHYTHFYFHHYPKRFFLFKN